MCGEVRDRPRRALRAVAAQSVLRPTGPAYDFSDSSLHFTFKVMPCVEALAPQLRPMIALPSTFARCSGTLLTFLFALLLAGCSVLFVAPYDATTDRLLTDLTVRTDTVVVEADNDQLSVAEREKFYAEAEETVSAMKMRAGTEVTSLTAAQDAINAALAVAAKTLSTATGMAVPFR